MSEPLPLHLWRALGGGLLIGFSTALYLLASGRIAGISGLAARALGLGDGERIDASAFLLSLVVGALGAARWLEPSIGVTESVPVLLASGLLVGYGTRLDAGCTSGHGVCGLARLSPRSIVAVSVFMLVAALTVFVTRHVLAMP